MRTILLTCFIICLTLGCASTSGIQIDGEVHPYPVYYSDYLDYCPDYPDYCQDYPDWYGYYPDELWYLDYYPYYAYYPYDPYYPYYPYYYWLDNEEDDDCLYFRDYWKQINQRIEYRREVWRKARETRIARINHAREKQREMRMKRLNRIRSGLERIRPRNIFRVLPRR